MSQKANPTLLGAFIVGGLLLAMAGFMIIGAGQWFHKRETYILYFNSSLKGLNAGAAVKFRGVTIGSVKEILIQHNQAEGDRAMPVIIEIREDVLNDKSDRSLRLSDHEKLKELIREGLRGQLQADSLLTGVLYVELAVDPLAAPAVFHQVKPVYQEIPTQPSQIHELLNNLAQFDAKGISDKLNSLLTKLDVAVDQLHVAEVSTGLTNLVASIDRLVGSPELTNSLASLRQAFENFRVLTEKIDGKIGPLSEKAGASLVEVRRTLVEMRKASEDLRSLLAPEAPLRAELGETIAQLGQAAQSISALADYLNRNPSALLTGRRRPEPIK